ncbi:MAG TPA: hypothetical protein VM689_04305 [Aliidongia sp.]|nr:hypothetical protein [Aliidongia sp.]
MVCFCKPSVAPLLSASASVSAALSASATLAIPALPPVLLSLSEILTLSPPVPFPPALLGPIEQLQIPQISLTAGLPTLMGLANLSIHLQANLGFDMPGDIAMLPQLMAQIDLAPLAPLAALPVAPLARLSALVALAAQVKAVLGIDLMNPPADIEARLAAALQIFLPQTPYPPFLLPKLQLMGSLRPLLALGVALKIDISDTAALAAALRPFVSLQLSAPIVPPTLLSALSLLSLLPSLNINLTETANLTEAMNASVGRLLAGMKLLFQAALRVNLPIPALLPPITMPEIELILRLDLPQLAAVNWQVPTTLPVLQVGLPMVSLLAHLQLIVPAVRLSPCSFGCPFG